MTVGERLREARERQKVSLHAIAAKTNISVRFLDAIEKNQFEKLPGGIFTRGFIRSYAAQVGLDPDATVAQFLSDEPGEREADEERAIGERQGIGLGVIVGAGVILIGVTLALVYVLAPDWLRSRTRANTDSAAPVADSAPATDTGTQPSTPPSQPSPELSRPAPATSAVTPPTADPTATPPSPKSPLHLVVGASRRCWVQVKADGQMRVARMIAPGERVEVDAAERLDLVVGDAGAFSYEINGRPGKSLGRDGAVARPTILPATVSQFQAP